ncbi:hypothetical protein EV421DRAFT_1858465 [Armillaria borealis]|uniref:F-box domain-containing protein n=1 Tax=Armillaria borealis TaxID=47425 RepID=A0AA39IVH5_9AGAR|nr:hypothetical protein EV421DRAFT_1858465 [Armillaria borealis]
MSSNFGTFSPSRKESFPPQTINEILSFVHDSNTLKSCTLVCRDWESTAQLYLFSVIHVGGHPPRHHNPYNVPHPLIPLHELHIFRRQSFIRELRVLQAPNNAFLQHLQFVLDNGDFRRLKAVVLDQTSLTMTGRTMAQIPRLILSNVSFAGPNGLLGLDFSRFGSSEDLRFEGIAFLSPPPTSQGPPANAPLLLQLKTLDPGSNLSVPCPNTLGMASEAVRHLLEKNSDSQHISLHNVHGQTELLTPSLFRGLRSLVLPMEIPN